MSSVRIKFTRGEEVKYISHLDLMKVFDRAMRRANIPIAYSQGFNPHPNMVFGLPLSVGVTSETEYADFEFSQDLEPESFAKIINSNLPAGLIVTESKYLSNKSNIMKEISMATYDLLVYGNNLEINDVSDKITELLKQPEIKTIKESKKIKKEINIKPMVYGISIKDIKTDATEDISFGNTIAVAFGERSWVKEYANEVLCKNGNSDRFNSDKLLVISLQLGAGNTANLKPELFINALNDKYELGLKIYKIHRTGLYVTNAGGIQDPLDDLILS